MSTDLDISHAIGGLLVTLPVLCMAAVAIPASVVADRFGAVPAVGACIAVLALAGAARAVAPDPASIVLLTIPVGLAIGLGGSLFPLVAKEQLPDEPAKSTSAYATGFALGATIAGSIAVGLADLLGSWRGPLLVYSIFGAVLTVVWFVGFRGRPRSARRAVRLPRPPWRQPVAWLIVAIFALQSLVFFCLVAWLPAFYVERGWPEQQAGVLVGVLIATGLPTSFLLGWVADRWGSRRRYLLVASLLSMVGVAGIFVVPDAGIAWAALAGVGLGMIFPLALTLPLDVATTSADAGGYVGLALGVGYLVAGLGPVALGALRDAAGSFAATLPIVAVFGVLMVLASAAVSPERLAGERARARAA